MSVTEGITINQGAVLSVENGPFAMAAQNTALAGAAMASPALNGQGMEVAQLTTHTPSQRGIQGSVPSGGASPTNSIKVFK